MLNLEQSCGTQQQQICLLIKVKSIFISFKQFTRPLNVNRTYIYRAYNQILYHEEHEVSKIHSIEMKRLGIAKAVSNRASCQ